MIDKLKNFFLWPLLAITSALSIYLLFVYFLAYILSSTTLISEDKLWHLISNELPYQHVDVQDQINLQQFVNTNLNRSDIKMVVFTSSDINAFAAPGNRVIVTSGLLQEGLSTEAIMFVIAHEIAHLSRKDHYYEAAKMITAGIYGFMAGSELLKELLLLVDNSKLKQTEFYADKFAAKLLLDNYQSIKGAEEFFQYLISSNKYQQSSTHPGAKERLQKIREVY